MIRTVLGDIEPKLLGKTFAHEHFIIDLDRVRKDGVSRIDTVEEVLPEFSDSVSVTSVSSVISSEEVSVVLSESVTSVEGPTSGLRESSMILLFSSYTTK